MHCMIAWGRTSDPTDADANAALERGLDGHAWVRTLPAVYVVALVYGEQERQEIVDKLVAIAKEREIDDFALLISPTITPNSGSYEGWLDLPLWDKVNQFSDGRQVAS